MSKIWPQMGSRTMTCNGRHPGRMGGVVDAVGLSFSVPLVGSKPSCQWLLKLSRRSANAKVPTHNNVSNLRFHEVFPIHHRSLDPMIALS
eukprot:6321650-Amphidinium_carterae.1